MPDTIGNISVPEPGQSGTFPLIPDFGYGHSHKPQIDVYEFGSANEKIEQRFLVGHGATRFHIRCGNMSETERKALRDFWEARKGPYQSFTFNSPSDDGQTTDANEVRFEQEPLTFEYLADCLSSTGITLVHVTTSFPVYNLASTETRFPGGTLSAAMLAQVQRFVPLVKIVPREAGYPAIYLSDRRCTIDSQLYQARLIGMPSGISQGIGGVSDQARFVFGNADKVMRDLSNDTNLYHASIEYSLYHIGTEIKLDTWKGEIVDFDGPQGTPEFTVLAADGLRELRLMYPPRTISPKCWKIFDGPDGACPFTASGTLDTGAFPLASAASCDKGWGSPNGCQAHSMYRHFGGIVADPQAVAIKDNSTGTWGFGRPTLTSVSLIDNTVAGEVIPEVYGPNIPVNLKMVSGREEGDFYQGVAVACEGPVTWSADINKHRLDGQAAHGPGVLGFRSSNGQDPAATGSGVFPSSSDHEFALADPGGFTSATPFAAGTAFLNIKRTDAKGFQASKVQEHQMTGLVEAGMGGWKWTAAPSTRSWMASNSNPIWINVNMLMRAKGLRLGQNLSSTQLDLAETFFDVQSAIDAATICDTVVDKVLGAGTETQFQFRGVLQEQKALRDWQQEVLNNCLGYWINSAGKVKYGIRVNSSAVHAFTAGNVILNSVRLRPRAPAFNRISGNFANEELENYAMDRLPLDSEEHAQLLGSDIAPQWLDADANLAGTFSRSQCARIIITALREELGGLTADDWKCARNISFQTTVLALGTEAGMVCSLTHDEMPTRAASAAPPNYGEFRVTGWSLDGFVITLHGTTTTDDMYNYVIGPKPPDAAPGEIPVEKQNVVLLLQPWFPHQTFPPSADPLLDMTDFQFDIEQNYESMYDKVTIPSAKITGMHPVTETLYKAPKIAAFSTSTSGGSIPNNSYVTVAITAMDSNGVSSAMSEPVGILVGSSGNAHKITLTGITWPAGTVGYRLYAAVDRRQISMQDQGRASQPDPLDLTHIGNVRKIGLPDPNFGYLRVRARQREHAGVVGYENTIGQLSSLHNANAGWTTDMWAGRIVSVYGDRSDGKAGIWNFTITANTDKKLTLDRNPGTEGVETGDVFTIRMYANIHSANTIGDALHVNPQYPAGNDVDGDVGYLVRIIAGTGAGQEKRILSNTATTYTIDGTWETEPDATSIFVVDRSTWEVEVNVARLPTSREGDVQVEAFLPLKNLNGTTLYIEAATIDHLGRACPSTHNSWREIYVFGAGDLGGAKATFGINVGADISGPTYDVTEHFDIEIAGAPFELVMNQKDWVDSGMDTIIDILVRDPYASDPSWYSIFPFDSSYAFNPTIPSGEDGNFTHTVFVDGLTFHVGQQLRLDVLSGVASGALFKLRWH